MCFFYTFLNVNTYLSRPQKQHQDLEKRHRSPWKPLNGFWFGWIIDIMCDGYVFSTYSEKTFKKSINCVKKCSITEHFCNFSKNSLNGWHFSLSGRDVLLCGISFPSQSSLNYFIEIQLFSKMLGEMEKTPNISYSNITNSTNKQTFKYHYRIIVAIKNNYN